VSPAVECSRHGPIRGLWSPVVAKDAKRRHVETQNDTERRQFREACHGDCTQWSAPLDSSRSTPLLRHAFGFRLDSRRYRRRRRRQNALLNHQSLPTNHASAPLFAIRSPLSAIPSAVPELRKRFHQLSTDQLRFVGPAMGPSNTCQLGYALRCGFACIDPFSGISDRSGISPN
jgi:hypothetical protein